jgi:hypothetical protein
MSVRLHLGVQGKKTLTTTLIPAVCLFVCHVPAAPEEAVRAGSAVDALLLWEMDQHLQHLKPLADAFRTADVRCRGVLGLEQFRVFCRRLNDAMSDEEVLLLWCDELRATQHGQVTFTAICRKLLPAM